MILLFSIVLSIIGIIGFVSSGYMVSALCGWLAAIFLFFGMRDHVVKTVTIEIVIAFIIRILIVHVNGSFFIVWGIAHSISVLAFSILSFLFTFLFIAHKN